LRWQAVMPYRFTALWWSACNGPFWRPLRPLTWAANHAAEAQLACFPLRYVVYRPAVRFKKSLDVSSLGFPLPFGNWNQLFIWGRSRMLPEVRTCSPPE
jgi:hypothetical protein